MLLLTYCQSLECLLRFLPDEGAHLGGGGKFLCLRGERFHVAPGDCADALLDLRNEGWSEAQFIDPETDEETRRDRIGSRFAADADVLALLVRGPSHS